MIRDDRSAPPNDVLPAGGLGRAQPAWDALAGRPGTVATWRRYGSRSPWTLRVVLGTRALYYLTPGDAGFHASVILGERATALALADTELPEETRAALRAARPYAEGRGVRVSVTSLTDVATVERLVAHKLAR